MCELIIIRILKKCRSKFQIRYSKCTVGKKKIERNTPIYSNTNHQREMKQVSITMHYCLHQFDALKVFLEVRLHGRSPSSFNFFNVNLQTFHRNRKVHLSNCLETNLKYLDEKKIEETFRN